MTSSLHNLRFDFWLYVNFLRALSAAEDSGGSDTAGIVASLESPVIACELQFRRQVTPAGRAITPVIVDLTKILDLVRVRARAF